ncbi:vacuolar protein sorting, putative [Perkinsus marinus ATCC 50983]|uniref:Vacuolar protein sorting, putative n=1 Tax=Perkinsus marinus (strain ATCC 50983 / TXsc) TaxID=423536 RepID=C5KWJ8_PERM5|nr:vacuolar protein sorting, putative [Perkinsus marinus ATCC 50983]EER11073.1 vacuolar protein sorting, putative [Perkinsus marinus ATCC 50983]|eukprot:XP_002779278.1 vacuolar protein sorting, putative [Perkinsus marinus ATCC 50983]
MTLPAAPTAVATGSSSSSGRSSGAPKLENAPGTKTMYLDPRISPELSLLVEVEDLKSHGVELWRKLDASSAGDAAAAQDAKQSSETLSMVDLVAEKILADDARRKGNKESAFEKTYTLICVPYVSHLVLGRLQQRTVMSSLVEVLPLHLMGLCVEGDVITIDQPGAFRDFHIRSNPTSLSLLAEALHDLQRNFGAGLGVSRQAGRRVLKMNAIGTAAKYVVDYVLRLAKEDDEAGAPVDGDTKAVKAFSGRDSSKPRPRAPPIGHLVTPEESSEPSMEGGRRKPLLPESVTSKGLKIEEFIVIDRRTDLFSVLCTQFTYESLLDRCLGIKYGYIDVGEPILPERKTVVLNSNDKLFDGIRDLRMEVLGPLLHKKASQIQETYSEKDRLSDIPQMKMYMDKFKSAQAEHASLADHVNLASFTSALTQMPWFQQQWQVGLQRRARWETPGSQPLDRVLRLVCLCSVVNGGIKTKILKALTKNLIEWYGPKLIVPLLHHMTACGLLKASSDSGADLVSSGSGKWQRMKQAFNLVVAGSNIAADTGIAYSYSGYAPLSVRLVELTEAEPNGWRGAAESLNLLWGPAIEVPPEVLPGSVDQEGTIGQGDKVVVVCFVGGVTYGEIAALRRLSAVERKGRRFLVVTTEMISHEKLFSEIIDEQL